MNQVANTLEKEGTPSNYKKLVEWKVSSVFVFHLVEIDKARTTFIRRLNGPSQKFNFTFLYNYPLNNPAAIIPLRCNDSY